MLNVNKTNWFELYGNRYMPISFNIPSNEIASQQPVNMTGNAASTRMGNFLFMNQLNTGEGKKERIRDMISRALF